MSKVVKIALRSLVFVAILSMIPLALGPSAPAGSPYMSSLTVSSGVTFADPTCKNKRCASPASCMHGPGFNCINPGAPTHCVTEAC